MICPNCNTQMKHLNKGDGHSSTDSYSTYDYLQCKSCGIKAIEFYHTEMIESEELPTPNFSLSYNPI